MNFTIVEPRNFTIIDQHNQSFLAHCAGPPFLVDANVYRLNLRALTQVKEPAHAFVVIGNILKTNSRDNIHGNLKTSVILPFMHDDPRIGHEHLPDHITVTDCTGYTGVVELFDDEE